LRSQQRRIRVIATIILLALAHTVPACISLQRRLFHGGAASPTPGPSEEQAGVTITFACHGYTRDQYETLAQQFHEANTGINVRVLSIEGLLDIEEEPGDFPLDGVQRLAGAADTMALDWLRPEDAQQGFVKDLTPLIQMDSTFDSEDFYPVALQDVQWDGGTWGLPHTITFHMVYYDQAAFDEAGLAYPEPWWTLDDFLAKAHALTEREGDQVTRWGFVEAWFDPIPFIVGHAGPLMDYSTAPPTPRMNRPQVAEAVRWFADLTLVHKVMPFFDPSEQQPGRSQGRALVDGGRARMWNQSSLDFLFEGGSHKVGMAPFPSDSPDYGPTPAWTRIYAMSAGTGHPQEAWRWIHFLTHRAVTMFEAFALPARRSVAEGTGFWERLSPDVAAALRYAAEHALSTNHHLAAQPLYGAVIKGEENVEQALAAAQEQAIQRLTEQDAARAQAPPQPVAVATPEPVQQEGVTIRFVAVYDLERFKELARDFHASHPDVNVDVPEPASGSYSLESVTTGADCYVWGMGDQNDARSRQYMLDLQPFADADPSLPMADFYPTVLESFCYQGDLWGLPSDTHVVVVYYNKALFDAARVAYPQPGWDLEDFIAKALALTRGAGEDKQYGFLPLFPHADAETFAALQGVSLFDEEAVPPQPRFDAPATVAAVARYVELHTVDEVSPGFFLDEDPTDPGTLNLEQRWALLKGDRAAMWINTSHLRAQFASAVDGLGVAPLPLNEGGTVSGYAEGYFIAPDTPHAQACWEWMRFLINDTGSRMKFSLDRI